MSRSTITTASLPKKIGVEDIMYYCRYLQLNFLGAVSRMPSSRTQRKIISSWIDEPRRRNYPQTYSRSMLKAMASVDIPEAHWQDLARDEVPWNKHIRQTDEDSSRPLRLYVNLMRASKRWEGKRRGRRHSRAAPPVR